MATQPDEFRRMRQIIGTTADWAEHDLILGDGELALERPPDNRMKAKIGNGVQRFSQLAYFGSLDTQEGDARYVQESETRDIGGLGAANLWPRLNAQGMLDPSLINIPSPLFYRGTVDPTEPPPAGAAPGDLWVCHSGGTVDLGWGPLAAGQAADAGDWLIYNNSGQWQLVPLSIGTVSEAPTDGKTYGRQDSLWTASHNVDALTAGGLTADDVTIAAGGDLVLTSRTNPGTAADNAALFNNNKDVVFWLDGAAKLTIQPARMTTPGAVFAGSFNINGQADFWIGGANPTFSLDAGDYFYYDRPSNTYSFVIGNVSRLQIQPDGTIRTYAQIMNAAPNSGGVALTSSGSTTNTGYISFMRADLTRSGFIGYMGTAAGGNIEYSNENGGGHFFKGGNVQCDVANTLGVSAAPGQVCWLNQFGDGNHLQRQVGNWGVSIFLNTGGYTWNIGGTPRLQMQGDGQIYHWHDIGPMNHNGSVCGRDGRQYWAVWSAQYVSTSDERQKKWRGELSAAELAAARDIISEIGAFQWLKELDESGEEAPFHVGVRAQAVWKIMARHELIPALKSGKPTGKSRYGFLRYAEWAEERTPAVPADKEHGTPGTPEHVHKAGNAFSIAPMELALFLAAAQQAQMDQMEARLAALEAA